MLPTVVAPPAGGNRYASSARRVRWRLCPRCGQWRSPGQFPSDQPVCGGCDAVLAARAARAAGVVERRYPLRGAELGAEMEWLLDSSLLPAEIIHATRSTSVAALERTLYRGGRADLASRLRAAQGRA